MQPGTLRALKILVVVMGVLIVVGTATLAVLIVQRIGGGGGGGGTTSASAGLLRQLDEPSGTAIASVSVGADRVAIQLRGGGPDRVVLLDARNGAVVARIALTR